MIRFRDKDLEPVAGETVLTCLERHGVAVPSSCRTGTCQTCLMRATAGEPSATSQAGLKEPWKKLGLFLPCVCPADRDLEIAMPDEGGLEVTSRVVDKRVRGDVVLLEVERPAGFDYVAGQFAHVVRDDGVTRPYSITTVASTDEHLGFHVRRLRGGAMSEWIADAVSVGSALRLRGPSGTCFYEATDPEQPLLLVGIGTGTGAVTAITRDALARGHAGPIWLYHASAHVGGLYFRGELEELSRSHPRLTVGFVALDADGAPGVEEGHIKDVIARDLPSLKGTRVFLCGDDAMVRTLKRAAFLAGASMAQIHADAFVGRASAPPS